MNKTTVNDAVVVQVFKTGEKGAGLWSRRGRKPQGYNTFNIVYIVKGIIAEVNNERID